MTQLNISFEPTGEGIGEAINVLSKMREGITGHVTPSLDLSEQVTNAMADLGTPPPPPAEDDEATESDPELDAEGLPWDERIHSSSMGKVAAGTWKLKRGVDPELVKQVQAEYRGGDTPPSPPAVDEEEQTPPPPPVDSSAGTPPPPPAVTPEGEITTVRDFMAEVVVKRKITMAAILAKVEEYGYPNLAELSKTEGMLSALAADLCTA